jgi:hypothetical protein
MCGGDAQREERARASEEHIVEIGARELSERSEEKAQ